MPLAGMALTYFFVNTVPIAIAIALTTNQSAWRIWKTDFASSAPSYLLGAVAAAVVIKVTRERRATGSTLLLTAAPLYLTYKMYRAGEESEARQGAILEAAHDAIITMDSAAEHPRVQPGRRADVRLRAARHPRPQRRAAAAAGRSRRSTSSALNEYLTTGGGPLAGRQLELTRPARRRHRVPARADGRADRRGQPRRR